MSKTYTEEELPLFGLVLYLLGVICYGIYRLVLYIWVSCGAWWEWLVGHITG